RPRSGPTPTSRSSTSGSPRSARRSRTATSSTTSAGSGGSCDREGAPRPPRRAAAVDFVAVGHVTVDQIGGGTQPGGAAYYAALTAWRLGLEAGVLTSFGPDFPRDA